MKYLITIILLTFFTNCLLAQTLIDKVVAVVGDKAVLYSEIEGQKLQAQQQGMKLTKEDDALLLEELMFQKPNIPEF